MDGVDRGTIGPVEVPDGGGGGGAPTWGGSFTVVPENLEASAPSFEAASGVLYDAECTVIGLSDPVSAGITDPGAAAAWSRAMNIWSNDLGSLGDELGLMSYKLSAAGSSYRNTDSKAMGG